MTKIRVTPHIAIDENELEESFIASSGPGGQNVNKVASAVQLRFDVARSIHLNEAVRARLMALAGSRLTKDGVLVMTGQKFRDQSRNRADVRERLVELIARAADIPKKRKATKPSRRAKEKRLERKKTHSRLKQTRSKKIED
jgi:ribosome-associated protein